MEKIYMPIMLMLLCTPIFSLGMNMEDEPVKVEELQELTHSNNWSDCTDEATLYTAVLKTNDLIAAIHAKDDKAITSIFKKYFGLRFTGKDAGNLVFDKQCFDLEEIVKCLVEVYPEYLVKILKACAKSGSVTILQLSLDNDLAISKVPLYILSIASRCENIEFCEKLILAGIFEGVRNKALAHSIYLHKYNVIESLIKDEQKTTAFLTSQFTELMMAVDSNNIDALKLLIETSNLNAKDNRGWTALMYAAVYGNVEAVRLLINSGADINCITNGGDTALTIAITSGNSAVIDILNVVSGSITQN